MKIGLKLYSSNEGDIKKLDFADFIEILPVPGVSLKRFKDAGFECTIHVPHSAFGFNPGSGKSIGILKEAVEAADYLNAKIIVVHGAFSGSKEDLAEKEEKVRRFFLANHDRRFYLENMAPFDKLNYCCCEAASMKRVLEKAKLKFCLDFAHASVFAASESADYRRIIKKLAKLRPDYFHLSDGFEGRPVDNHLHLRDGNLDIGFFADIIKKSRAKKVCLEVPVDIEGRKKDVELLRKW